MVGVGVVILGSRVFSEEVADLVVQAGEEVAGFVENLEPERCREPLNGVPVIWIDDVAGLAAHHAAVCGLSTTQRRRFVDQAAAAGFGFTQVRHPSAIVSPTAELGEGCVVGARVVVGAHTRVGAHVILNRGVLVGHHTRIGDCVTLSPGANVAGAVTIGDQAYVGMGATVLDHRSIGEGAVVGAGAVVTRDVPARTQVQGVPARVVKEGIEPL